MREIGREEGQVQGSGVGISQNVIQFVPSWLNVCYDGGTGWGGDNGIHPWSIAFLGVCQCFASCWAGSTTCVYSICTICV